MKYFKYAFFIVLVVTAGCTNTLDYNDDAIVAIVKGDEITIGELRFLYPDENVLEMIEGSVKAELVIQEAKLMNLEVSEEINRVNEMMMGRPLEDMSEFAEAQAVKLGMDSEEYYKKYVEITTKQIVYMQAYVEDLLGQPGNTEDEIEEYNEKANDLLNELVQNNLDDIEILIK